MFIYFHTYIHNKNTLYQRKKIASLTETSLVLKEIEIGIVSKRQGTSVSITVKIE